MIKPVVQEHPSGCAIASVAAITGNCYQDMAAIAATLGVDAGDKSLWSQIAPMKKMLAHTGVVSFKQQPFLSWQQLPDCALLAIKWREIQGVAYWHWVVFYRSKTYPEGVVLDSKATLKKHQRTDFGRIKPKWFIEVIKPPN